MVGTSVPCSGSSRSPQAPRLACGGRFGGPRRRASLGAADVAPALALLQPGDLLLIAAGPAGAVNRALDRVRQFLGKDLGLIKVG